MKYFTKEWYNDLLISEMCFQLRKTENASVFSEPFFKRLYFLEERAYLRFSKRALRASSIPFDKEAVRTEFASNYETNLKFVKENLPEEILQNVKDIRVLALGSATHDIAMQITRYCGKKNRLCEAIEKKYNDASEESDEKIDRDVLNTLVNINNSELSSVKEDENGNVSFFFIPQNSQEEKGVTLVNAKKLEDDRTSENMTIVKHEMLLNEEGKADFSLLLYSSSGTLHTVSYEASEITVAFFG